MASNKVISDYVNDLLTTSELIDLIKELETTKNKAYPKAAKKKRRISKKKKEANTYQGKLLLEKGKLI